MGAKRSGSARPEPRTAVAILAAGKGTRLKSKHPKVLHEVGGKPLLAHVIAAARQVVPAQDIFAIIGHEAELVQKKVESTGIQFVVQQPQRGTGHALMCAESALQGYDEVLVLSGDAPLITPGTIRNLRDCHRQKKAAMTILSVRLEDPTGYGRIITAGARSDELKAIVEENSCSVSQRKIREINSGFYVFAVKALYENIRRIKTDNPHAEYYLTDMAEVLQRAKERVSIFRAEDPGEILGGNTRAELVDLDRDMRRRKCLQLMGEGVTIFYPETCVIDCDVEIGADTTIEPFVQIFGNTQIGSECRIRSYSIIQNSRIGDGVVVRAGCVIDEAQVDDAAVVGPYSHLRPGSEIGAGAHVGNFVETKKVRLGKKSKANHLTYLGDAEIGECVNIGAGTITCNYDGVQKTKTIIEDDVFVGSDSTLVAPVTLGKGAYVGASSCITEDVPAGSLALGRAKQIVKEGWVAKKRKSTL